jgi:hypothetical protein
MSEAALHKQNCVRAERFFKKYSVHDKENCNFTITAFVDSFVFFIENRNDSSPACVLFHVR